MLKNVSFVLSPGITIPVLDETPIAVPAPALKPSHENIAKGMKVLPETAFRGTVNRRQAAPDKDLRQTPAGTIEPRMSESKTIKQAKREVVQRTKRQQKTRGYRISRERMGKAAMTLFLDPKLRERLNKIAAKRGETTQAFLNKVLDQVAAEYEVGSTPTMRASNAVFEQSRQLEKSLQQLTSALTLSTSPK